MDIIKNNPYRILGVYANSPTKERIANLNKLKAFLKVGKTMDFHLDLPQYLPPLNRTAEIVSHADACLTLPNEQLKYAQFWFIKANPVDDIAFNHLFAGNIDNAIAIWEKVDNVFSLQNRIVCSLIKKDYKAAFSYAELFYSYYQEKFIQEICGNNIQNLDSLLHIFLNALCSELGTSKVLCYLPNNEWEKYVKGKASIPLIDNIQNAIEAAKDVKREDAQARYDAGVKLRDNTIESLKELKLIGSDLQYQQIADKLGLEILQCGIDYFNSSVEANETRKTNQTISLFEHALSVVVGRIAKERCEENMNKLKQLLKQLPPEVVFEENCDIQSELDNYFHPKRDLITSADFDSFRNNPYAEINKAMNLLKSTKPILQNVRIKLGNSHSWYLAVSTSIVNTALNKVIEEVNKSTFHSKSFIELAWDAMELMYTFDMESDFRLNRYNTNRKILKDICEQYGIFSANATQVQTMQTSHSPITNNPSHNVSTKVNKDTGWEAIAWIVVICVIAIIVLSYIS